MPSGLYHVGLTKDPEKYLDGKNKYTGFFSHPKNRGKCKVVKLYKGDYKAKIHAFGVKAFIKLLDNEANLEHFILELIC